MSSSSRGLLAKLKFVFSGALILSVAFTPAAYADQEPSGDDSSISSAQANESKVFNTAGDYVHISNTPPRTASGHGWWENVSSDATLADVTVQLQVLNSGNWVKVGPAGTARVRSGGGAGNRATGRYGCANSLNVSWRSVVDVDLVGYADSPERLYTPSRLLQCGV